LTIKLQFVHLKVKRWIFGNGNPYLDPEGKIIKYGYSSLTCEVTYMIEKPTGNVIKYVVPVANNEPIKLATAKVYNNEYVIKTVTGKEMTARNIVLIAKGFLAYREGCFFCIQTWRRDSKLNDP